MLVTAALLVAFSTFAQEYKYDKDITFYELGGFDHGGMAKPAHTILLKYIKNDK